jgi:hypothetical protein
LILLKGKPSVRFEQDAWLRSSTNTVSAQPNTFFIAVKYDNGGSIHYAFDSSGDNRQSIGVTQAGYRLFAGGTSTDAFDATAVNRFVHMIHTGLFNGSSSQQWRNSISIGTGAILTGGFDRATIGARGGSESANRLEGNLQEIFVYQSAQSSASRSAIEANMNKYWDIF